MMAIKVSILVILSSLMFTQPALSQVPCAGAKLQAIGCFADEMSSSRPLPVPLFTDTNAKDKKFSGVKRPAAPNKKYIEDLICRCAKSALNKGYNTVGITAGECLSGANAASTFMKDGRSASCIGSDLKRCTPTGSSCVGNVGNNFVYKVQKATTKPTTPPKTGKLNCKDYIVTVKIMTKFNYGLISHSSIEFGKLRLELQVGVIQAYDGYKDFIGAHVLRFEKSSDGLINGRFVIHFTKNGSHLDALEKKIATGKLGNLAVSKTLTSKSCYEMPTYCPGLCPAICAPTCTFSCCGHYSPSPPPPCGISCPAHCAPSCSTTCCVSPPPQLPSPPPPPPPPPPCPHSCSSYCAPGCSLSCCSPRPLPLPPQVTYCAHGCSPSCAPNCSYSCCAMRRGYKRNHAATLKNKKNRKVKQI